MYCQVINTLSVFHVTVLFVKQFYKSLYSSVGRIYVRQYRIHTCRAVCIAYTRLCLFSLAFGVVFNSLAAIILVLATKLSDFVFYQHFLYQSKEFLNLFHFRCNRICLF